MRTKRERLEDRLTDLYTKKHRWGWAMSAKENRSVLNRIEKTEAKIEALPCDECNGKGYIRGRDRNNYPCGECDLGDAYADQAAREAEGVQS